MNLFYKTKLIILSILMALSTFAAEESYLIIDKEETSNVSVKMEINANFVTFSKCNAVVSSKCIPMGEISMNELEKQIKANNGRVHNNRVILGVSTAAMVLGVIGTLSSNPELAGTSAGLATGGMICLAAWFGVTALDKSLNTLGTTNKLEDILSNGINECRLGLRDENFEIESFDSFVLGLEMILD